MADRSPSPSEPSAASLVTGLVRSLGTLLGLHVQHAQQEACADVARLVGGALLLLFALLTVGGALLFGELALVYYLAERRAVGWLPSLLVVGGADLLLGILLALWARAKLRRPMLEQTRTLLRRTVKSMSET